MMMRRRGGGGPPLGGETVLMGGDMESDSLYYKHQHPSNNRRNGPSLQNTMGSIQTGPKLVCLGILMVVGVFYLLVWGSGGTSSVGADGGSTADYASLLGLSEFLQDSPAAFNDEYVVFVTVSNGLPGETYIALSRSKLSPLDALQQATSKLPRNSTRHYWIKIDVVTGLHRLEEFDYAESIESPGPLFGIGLDWDHEWVFLPEEVIAHGLIDQYALLRWERVVSYARRKQLQGWPVPTQSDDGTKMETPLDLFRTKSVFYDTTVSPKPVELYHGHRVFSGIEPEQLHDAVRRATEYILNMIVRSGRIIHQYMPRSHHRVTEGPVHRHARGLYALAKSYRIDPNSKLKKGMEQALQYLLKRVHPCPAPYEPSTIAKCVTEDIYEEDGTQESWTGTNAETIMAIAEYMDVTNDWSPFEPVKELAYWITHAIKMDDWFIQWVQLPELDLDEDHYSRYEHSRTIFALVRLYNLVRDKDGQTPENEWIGVAIRALDVIIAYDAESTDLDDQIDGWLLKALSEIHQYNNKLSAKYKDHVSRAVRSASEHQEGDVEDISLKDWRGVYYEESSVKTTAIFSEALCSIHRMTIDHGLHDEAATLAKSVEAAVRYQLQLQYSPEFSMYMKNPGFLLGGFRDRLDVTEMRIDYTSQSINSMLCTINLLDKAGKV